MKRINISEIIWKCSSQNHITLIDTQAIPGNNYPVLYFNMKRLWSALGVYSVYWTVVNTKIDLLGKKS